MKGYKAFKQDLTCLCYQFTTDNNHTFDGTPILCKRGFHFCTDLQDIVKYYHQPDMRVFEIEATGIVTDAEKDCSKRACSEITLVKELSLDEVMLNITKSEPAYLWAKRIGNRDIMINHINDSQYAYYWARDIGNRDIMIDRIADSEYAYRWAKWIGNRDIMINHVTESKWAYFWARDIGNRDIMINHVNESMWTYYWAYLIGNIDIMKSRVTEPYWIGQWNETFLNYHIL